MRQSPAILQWPATFSGEILHKVTLKLIIFCMPPERIEGKASSGRPLTVKLKVKNKSPLLTSISGPQTWLIKFIRKVTAQSARNLNIQLIKLLNEPLESLTSDASGIGFWGFGVLGFCCC